MTEVLLSAAHTIGFEAEDPSAWIIPPGEVGTALNQLMDRAVAGGEINTASNQGTDGVGVFDTKVGVDLQFRNIAPASSKISVALNGKDVDLDVVEANLSLANLGSKSHASLTDIGAYSHAAIDTHIGAAVTAGSAFGTDLAILVADGTGRGAKASTHILDGPFIKRIGGANPNVWELLSAGSASVNWLGTSNHFTGNDCILLARGEADRGIQIWDSNNNEMVVMASVASAVGYLEVTTAIDGNPVLLTAKTSTTNAGMTLDTSGTGVITLDAATTIVGALSVDTIGERTGAAGVTIENVLLKNGRVGVGTATPSQHLHISTSGVPTIRLSDSGAPTDQGVATLIELYRGDNTNRVGFWGMESFANNVMALATDYTAGEISLKTGANVERLRISSTGNFDFKAGNLTTTGLLLMGLTASEDAKYRIHIKRSAAPAFALFEVQSNVNSDQCGLQFRKSEVGLGDVHSGHRGGGLFWLQRGGGAYVNTASVRTVARGSQSCEMIFAAGTNDPYMTLENSGDVTFETSGVRLNLGGATTWIEHDAAAGMGLEVPDGKAFLLTANAVQCMGVTASLCAFGPSGGPRGNIEYATAGRLQIRDNASNTAIRIEQGPNIGFLGANAVGRPAVAGSWAGNVAGQNLAAALATLGLITDNTT